MDHISDYVYVHIMGDLYLSENLLDKEAWEKLMAQSGRTVKRYHANNDRFSENGFIDSINQKYQKISFCRVGDHRQNGIVENKNKILTNGAGTFLIHGMRMWQKMIEKMIWPFAMKDISEKLNSLQIYHKRITPKSFLHGVKVEIIPVKSSHTLFIPIYVPDARLQNDVETGPKIGAAVTY